MADTTFVSKVTNLVTTWVQAINNFVYRGADPNFAVLTGGPTAYVLTLPSSSAITALTPGMKLRFQVNIPNTGPVTLTLQPMGLTNDLRLPGGIPLVYGEMAANMATEVIWNGSYWELLSSTQVPFNNDAPLVRRTGLPLVDLRINVSNLSADRALTMIDQDVVIVGRDNAQILTNKVIARMVGQATLPGSVSGAVSLDTANHDFYVWTLTGNITSITFGALPVAGFTLALTLVLIQGGTGSYTVTWPGSVLWPAATAPTLTTTVGKSDVITLVTYDGGASWRGFVAGQNY